MKAQTAIALLVALACLTCAMPDVVGVGTGYGRTSNSYDFDRRAIGFDSEGYTESIGVYVEWHPGEKARHRELLQAIPRMQPQVPQLVPAPIEVNIGHQDPHETQLTEPAPSLDAEGLSTQIISAITAAILAVSGVATYGVRRLRARSPVTPVEDVEE